MDVHGKWKQYIRKAMLDMRLVGNVKEAPL